MEARLHSSTEASLKSLSNEDGDGNENGYGNENGKKKQWAWIGKTTTLHVHHAFCTFPGRYCTTTT